MFISCLNINKYNASKFSTEPRNKAPSPSDTVRGLIYSFIHSWQSQRTYHHNQNINTVLIKITQRGAVSAHRVQQVTCNAHAESWVQICPRKHLPHVFFWSSLLCPITIKTKRPSNNHKRPPPSLQVVCSWNKLCNWLQHVLQLRPHHSEWLMWKDDLLFFHIFPFGFLKM